MLLSHLSHLSKTGSLGAIKNGKYANRIRCPFHNGKDYNAVVYQDGSIRCYSRCACYYDMETVKRHYGLWEEYKHSYKSHSNSNKHDDALKDQLYKDMKDQLFEDMWDQAKIMAHEEYKEHKPDFLIIGDEERAFLIEEHDIDVDEYEERRIKDYLQQRAEFYYEGFRSFKYSVSPSPKLMRRYSAYKASLEEHKEDSLDDVDAAFNNAPDLGLKKITRIETTTPVKNFKPKIKDDILTYAKYAGEVIGIYNAFNFGTELSVASLVSIGIKPHRARAILKCGLFNTYRGANNEILGRVSSARHFAQYMRMNTNDFIDSCLGVWGKVKDNVTLEQARLSCIIEAKNSRGKHKMPLRFLAAGINRSMSTTRKRLKGIKGLIIQANYKEALVEDVEDVSRHAHTVAWSFLNCTDGDYRTVEEHYNVKSRIRNGEIQGLLDRFICFMKWRTVNSYILKGA